jgi:hypothetical protein
MAEIFLSYRRQDSQSATGRLADRLEAHFGAQRVFRDHESIVAGEDFAEAIRRAVTSATVLLVIVGPRWLGARTDHGRRRLDDPHDFVRLEIEMALAADVAVVPVLVEDATMPPADALPASLAEFARCQAVELSETRWRYDADQLIGTLQTRFAIASEQPALAAGVAPSGWSARATGLAIDLLDLAARPARMIARRNTGRASDHLRAFGFLLACIGAGNLALLIGLNIHPAPGTLLPGPWFGLLGWLANGELVGVLALALLAALLTLAWRLTGTPLQYRQVTLVFAYVYGGLWLGFCAGALLIGSAVQAVDPNLLDRVLPLMLPTGGPADAARWNEAQALLENGFRGPAAGLALIGMVLWAGTGVWFVVAWGAFGNALGVGRLKATAAATLWLALLAGIGWAMQRLA